jgi:hypothetical protein
LRIEIYFKFNTALAIHLGGTLLDIVRPTLKVYLLCGTKVAHALPLLFL